MHSYVTNFNTRVCVNSHNSITNTNKATTNNDEAM